MERTRRRAHLPGPRGAGGPAARPPANPGGRARRAPRRGRLNAAAREGPRRRLARGEPRRLRARAPAARPGRALEATAALQSEGRTRFRADGWPRRKTPDCGDSPPGALTKPPRLRAVALAAARNVPRWRGGPGAARGYLRGQRALPRGAGSGARRSGGAGPARLAGAGGSGPSRRRTRIPAAPPPPGARSPGDTEPKGGC